jgi:hypothetical protein
MHATDKKTGLPYSEISGSDYGKNPRGCALSFSTHYMSYFAPEEAKELWKKYKKNYKKNYLLFAGFREWPVGVKGKEDTDSGPIIFDIGSAATGLAILGAKAMNDKITYFQLKNTIGFARLGIDAFSLMGNRNAKSVFNNLLFSALAFNSNIYIKNWKK